MPSGVVTVTTYQFSNYDCSGNLGGWAGQSAYYCFGEVYLRVLPDSGSAPVSGANVTTAYDFAQTCYPNTTPCQNPAICGEAFKNFTTTSTEWYAFGDSTDSFSVVYGGQTYVVTASQMAASTCETLHVPSGAINSTYGASCAAGGSTFTSTTLSSSTTSASSPGCGLNSQHNTAPKPTVYVKVVTDQGMVITNGTLNVVQLESMTGGFETSRYCVSLSEVQGTGYVRLADLNQSGSSANLITGGYYNVTLMAGYDQGPWYNATIPSIQINPNSTVYVTVSVPSGVVTVVNSNEGSSAVTTTTTSATTSTSTNENQFNQYDCGGWVQADSGAKCGPLTSDWLRVKARPSRTTAQSLSFTPLQTPMDITAGQESTV